jgi:hypothetical protein
VNESLIRHLGVALLGHHNIKHLNYPSAMTGVFRRYRDNETLLPNLLTNKPLKAYLLEYEIEISSTSTGAASLIALAIIYGELPFNIDIRYHLEPKQVDLLFNKLKTRLKIRMEKEIL